MKKYLLLALLAVGNLAHAVTATIDYVTVKPNTNAVIFYHVSAGTVFGSASVQFGLVAGVYTCSTNAINTDLGGGFYSCDSQAFGNFPGSDCGSQFFLSDQIHTQVIVQISGGPTVFSNDAVFTWLVSTATITPTNTPSPTITPTFSISPTSTFTATRTASPTITNTFSISPTFSVSPTKTATRTVTKTATPTFTATSTFTKTTLPTRYPTPAINDFGNYQGYWVKEIGQMQTLVRALPTYTPGPLPTQVKTPLVNDLGHFETFDRNSVYQIVAVASAYPTSTPLPTLIPTPGVSNLRKTQNYLIPAVNQMQAIIREYILER